MMLLLVGVSLLGAIETGVEAADQVRREKRVGSHLPRRVEMDVWEADKTRKVQAEFGECVIKKHLATAQHFVLTPNMEPAQWRKDVKKIADGHCLVAATAEHREVEMKFPVDTMRYALAEALVRREFSVGPAPSIKDAAPLDQPKLDEDAYVLEPGKKPRKGELEELQVRRTKQIALIYLAEFGECVVRADSANSHALLMTEVGSAEESRTLKGMMPAFGGCLLAGQSLEFNKSTLRGTIAMNYYRLAHAPRAATAIAGAKN